MNHEEPDGANQRPKRQNRIRVTGGLRWDHETHPLRRLRRISPAAETRRCCSDACRKRDWRRRTAPPVVDWTAAGEVKLTPYLAPDGPTPPPPPEPPAAPPEEQLVRALAQLHTIAAYLRQLSRQLGRPQLRWRSEKLGNATTAACEDLYPVR